MGWRERWWAGPWPGRGPFSYLPPWQRPGWLYGRGACWLFLASYFGYRPSTAVPSLKPEDERKILMEQKTFIEEQVKALQEALKRIEGRLEELKE
jgi:hypothetical protein